ncbi:MAG: isoprenylcysteine carboxyl methyltransferase family protein [Brevundimonas sp.]
MILSVVILSLVTAQRIGELVLARRNTRRLLARGAVETGAGHYPFMVALHAAWLIGLWLLAWDRPLNLWLLAVFIGLQAARVWVIASLGRRWTTRIITLPGEPLIRHGPYRFMSHPNYVVVAAEILILPLAFGLVWFALVFSALNAAMMRVRIRIEGDALIPETAQVRKLLQP